MPNFFPKIGSSAERAAQITSIESKDVKLIVEEYDDPMQQTINDLLKLSADEFDQVFFMSEDDTQRKLASFLEKSPELMRLYEKAAERRAQSCTVRR